MANEATIYVLTYDFPHRKTYDVLSLLKATSKFPIVVSVQPMTYAKTFNPLIQHRPSDMWQMKNMAIEEIWANMKLEWTHELPPEGSTVLIGGAGILPLQFVNSRRVINSHPRYLPYIRGLDALKWAIWEEKPIGVTTHLCGEVPDAGVMIDQEMISLYPTDTFHSVAQRLYELEISMLVAAPEKEIENRARKVPQTILLPETILHRRMSADIESRLMAKFQRMIDASNYHPSFAERQFAYAS